MAKIHTAYNKDIIDGPRNRKKNHKNKAGLKVATALLSVSMFVGGLAQAFHVNHEKKIGSEPENPATLVENANAYQTTGIVQAGTIEDPSEKPVQTSGNSGPYSKNSPLIIDGFTRGTSAIEHVLFAAGQLPPQPSPTVSELAGTVAKIQADHAQENVDRSNSEATVKKVGKFAGIAARLGFGKQLKSFTEVTP